MKIAYDDYLEPEQVCSKDCPWTGFSYGVDMGCLPDAYDMVKRAQSHNQIVSCHSNEKIACIGIKKFLTRQGIDTEKMTVIPQSQYY